MPAWSLRCPRGHASVEIGTDRFWCRTCERTDGLDGAFDKSELVDLSSEEAA